MNLSFSVRSPLSTNNNNNNQQQQPQQNNATTTSQRYHPYGQSDQRRPSHTNLRVGGEGLGMFNHPLFSALADHQQDFFRFHHQQHMNHHREQHTRHRQQHLRAAENLFEDFSSHFSQPINLHDFFNVFPNHQDDDDDYDDEQDQYEQEFVNHSFQQYQQTQDSAPPTSQRAIDNFPTFIFTSEQEETMRANEFEMGCSICQCDFERDETLISLPCQHTFHKDCILPWINKNNSCPNCRFELPLDDKALEAERLQRMKDRFTSEGLQVLEIGANVNAMLSTVYHIRAKVDQALTASSQPDQLQILEGLRNELTRLETKLEHKLCTLDSLQEFKLDRVKEQRKHQIVKIQTIQRLIAELKKQMGPTR